MGVDQLSVLPHEVCARYRWYKLRDDILKDIERHK